MLHYYILKQVKNCIDKIARILGAVHVRSDVTISLSFYLISL